MNVSTKQKQIQRYREQTLWLPRERGGGEGMDWEFGLADANWYTRMDKQQGPT